MSAYQRGFAHAILMVLVIILAGVAFGAVSISSGGHVIGCAQ